MPSVALPAMSARRRRRPAELDPDNFGAAPPVLATIEEGAHLLRAAPTRGWAFYALGTVPFVLGFLWFWADMSRNVNAADHVVEASLGLALLFVWMKAWQAAAASEWLHVCAGAPAPPWTWRRAMRTLAFQARWQPLKVVLLPLAGLLNLPFAFAAAFFHHLSAVGDGTQPPAEATRRARLAARAWTGQNFRSLGLVALLSAPVFLNMFLVCGLVPILADSFLGTQGEATRNAAAYFFNTTTLAAALALAHLVLHPLTTAFYVMRLFRFESRRDGRDLLRVVGGEPSEARQPGRAGQS